jgi:hypothetical protein
MASSPGPVRTTTTPWYVPATPDSEPTAEQLAAIEYRVGVPVEFDQQGWLSGAIEVRVACNRLECALVPKSIRVSGDSPVRELIDDGGIVARCQTYSEIIRTLRRLRSTFDDALTRHRPSPDSDPDFHASHAALRTVQTTALVRLDRIMGVGLIMLHALNAEIDYLDRCLGHYRRALARIEHGSAPSAPGAEPDPWDEDTLDPWDKGGP